MPRNRFIALRTVAWGLTMMCILPGTGFLAQTSNPTASTKATTGHPIAVSLPHLYWHFLVYQHQLDQMAVEHEKQGKDGRWLRSYLQIRLSMTDAEFQPIRESADRLDAAVNDITAKAATLTTQYSGLGPQPREESIKPQTIRDELRALTSQRETAIQSEVSFLGVALTPEADATLRKYLLDTFSKSVTVKYPKSQHVKKQGDTLAGAVKP